MNRCHPIISAYNYIAAQGFVYDLENAAYATLLNPIQTGGLTKL